MRLIHTETLKLNTIEMCCGRGGRKGEIIKIKKNDRDPIRTDNLLETPLRKRCIPHAGIRRATVAPLSQIWQYCFQLEFIAHKTNNSIAAWPVSSFNSGALASPRIVGVVVILTEKFLCILSFSTDNTAALYTSALLVLFTQNAVFAKPSKCQRQ